LRSSVCGMVKNCGAWGSIAPPMTVDRMAYLLLAFDHCGHHASQRKN
jgi:hypothetical protein